MSLPPVALKVLADAKWQSAESAAHLALSSFLNARTVPDQQQHLNQLAKHIDTIATDTDIALFRAAFLWITGKRPGFR